MRAGRDLMQKPEELVERVFQRLRESNWLNLPEWESEKQLGLSWDEVRDLVQQGEYLEIVEVPRKDGRGTFEVVRPALTAEGLALLGAVDEARLRRTFRSADDRRRLDAAMKTQESGGAIGVPDSGDPLGDQDFEVLASLEDLEAERINFGLYDTF